MSLASSDLERKSEHATTTVEKHSTLTYRRTRGGGGGHIYHSKQIVILGPVTSGSVSPPPSPWMR